jgi:DNA-binding transcriptional MerR regulator/predicted N-acetyltransferase YhbS
MIKIGEFSRLSQTPVSTLRYYAELGLLTPVEVDHFTGYRYYTFDQLARLNRILALKDLGFSLDEIPHLLDEHLPAQRLRELLQRKRGELLERVQDQQERLQQLDAWLHQLTMENPMPAYTIRHAAIDTDLPGIVRITNPYEIQPVTTEQVREWFQYNPPGRLQRRLVAVDANHAVTGYGGFVHEADGRDNTFITWVIVDPDWRGQGIGSALWDSLLSELRTLGATRLVSDVFDNDAQSLVFAQRRGFAIDEHSFNYALDLTGFDETPFLAATDELSAQGIRFCALADFPDTSETHRKLYELNISNVLEDPNGVPSWSFAGFEEFVIRAPWFRRDGQLLAVAGDEWIGMSPVSIFPAEGTAYNLHLCVLPAYRRRKIATSLMMLAARFARQNGAERIIADSTLRNTPALTIFRRLGYKVQPGKYTLVCDL